MRKSRGFIRGWIVPIFLCFCLGWMIYHTDISFSGSKMFKPLEPLWERLSDKTIQVVKAIF